MSLKIDMYYEDGVLKMKSVTPSQYLKLMKSQFSETQKNKRKNLIKFDSIINEISRCLKQPMPPKVCVRSKSISITDAEQGKDRNHDHTSFVSSYMAAPDNNFGVFLWDLRREYTYAESHRYISNNGNVYSNNFAAFTRAAQKSIEEGVNTTSHVGNAVTIIYNGDISLNNPMRLGHVISESERVFVLEELTKSVKQDLVALAKVCRCVNLVGGAADEFAKDMLVINDKLISTLVTNFVFSESYTESLIDNEIAPKWFDYDFVFRFYPKTVILSQDFIENHFQEIDTDITFDVVTRKLRIPIPIIKRNMGQLKDYIGNILKNKNYTKSEKEGISDFAKITSFII